jgi:hypothetical protein
VLAFSAHIQRMTVCHKVYFSIALDNAHTDKHLTRSVWLAHSRAVETEAALAEAGLAAAAPTAGTGAGTGGGAGAASEAGSAIPTTYSAAMAAAALASQNLRNKKLEEFSAAGSIAVKKWLRFRNLLQDTVHAACECMVSFAHSLTIAAASASVATAAADEVRNAQVLGELQAVFGQAVVLLCSTSLTKDIEGGDFDKEIIAAITAEAPLQGPLNKLFRLAQKIPPLLNVNIELTAAPSASGPAGAPSVISLGTPQSLLIQSCLELVKLSMELKGTNAPIDSTVNAFAQLLEDMTMKRIQTAKEGSLLHLRAVMKCPLNLYLLVAEDPSWTLQMQPIVLARPPASLPAGASGAAGVPTASAPGVGLSRAGSSGLLGASSSSSSSSVGGLPAGGMAINTNGSSGGSDQQQQYDHNKYIFPTMVTNALMHCTTEKHKHSALIHLQREFAVHLTSLKLLICAKCGTVDDSLSREVPKQYLPLRRMFERSILSSSVCNMILHGLQFMNCSFREQHFLKQQQLLQQENQHIHIAEEYDPTWNGALSVTATNENLHIMVDQVASLFGSSGNNHYIQSPTTKDGGTSTHRDNSNAQQGLQQQQDDAAVTDLLRVFGTSFKASHDLLRLIVNSNSNSQNYLLQQHQQQLRAKAGGNVKSISATMLDPIADATGRMEHEIRQVRHCLQGMLLSGHWEIGLEIAHMYLKKFESLISIGKSNYNFSGGDAASPAPAPAPSSVQVPASSAGMLGAIGGNNGQLLKSALMAVGSPVRGRGDSAAAMGMSMGMSTGAAGSGPTTPIATGTSTSSGLKGFGAHSPSPMKSPLGAGRKHFSFEDIGSGSPSLSPSPSPALSATGYNVNSRYIGSPPAGASAGAGAGAGAGAAGGVISNAASTAKRHATLYAELNRVVDLLQTKINHNGELRLHSTFYAVRFVSDRPWEANAHDSALERILSHIRTEQHTFSAAFWVEGRGPENHVSFAAGGGPAAGGGNKKEAGGGNNNSTSSSSSSTYKGSVAPTIAPPTEMFEYWLVMQFDASSYPVCADFYDEILSNNSSSPHSESQFSLVSPIAYHNIQAQVRFSCTKNFISSC